MLTPGVDKKEKRMNAVANSIASLSSILPTGFYHFVVDRLKTVRHPGLQIIFFT